ncbi:unnamed protein product [Durusdinium trenchii]|uniref:Uncharacterized protein n=1 Tax=Durusdinium trenchii TaxID=1381693 RepID=A0ABP0RHP4_9DINO
MSAPALDEVGWGSFLAFKWLDSLVNTGYQRQVNLQDSPPLADQEDTARNTRRYVRLLEEQERAGKRHPLIHAIFWVFWPQLLLLQSMKISQYLLGLLSPFILQRLLIFQEAQEAKTEGTNTALSAEAARSGFIAVGALICLGLFNLFYNAQVDLWKARLNIRIESSLKGALLFRGVQGLTQTPGDASEQGNTHGESAIYNVISFDVGDSVNMVWVILDIWSLPIQLVTAFTALFAQVALAVVPGLLTIIICKTFNLIMGYADGVYRDRLYFAKDERLGRCSEGFTNIRTLRMLAWTSSYERVISRARAEELRMAWIRLWLQKMPAALDYGLSTLVTLVTLGFYVHTTHEQLKASLALPVMLLIGSLIGPIGQFPVLVKEYKVFRSAYDRFHRFMGFGHQPKPFEPESARSPTSSPAALNLEDCSFQWAAQEPLLAQAGPFFELQNIDLQVEAGSTTAIISQEGQGKSSLLMAILGEMSMKSGHFSGSSAPIGGQAPVVPETAISARHILLEACTIGGRSVALAPQEPWLFAGSVRSNVLFGLEMHQAIYDGVLEACALRLDLQTMPCGDMTEIAAGGSTISGGQRARVGLARAVYRAALEQEARRVPLVVLDDPFCALDKEVATQVCQAVLSPSEGLLRHSTVLVAAADPWWMSCLAGANGEIDAGIIILRSGSVLVQGTFSELKGQDLPELKTLVAPPLSRTEGVPMHNPQDEDMADESETPVPERHPEDAVPRLPPLPPPQPSKRSEAETQTPLTKEQEIKGSLTLEEGRVAGHVQWGTYHSYLKAMGYFNFVVMFVALAGIMLFQNFCNLWIVYWTSEKKETALMYSWMKAIGIAPPTDTRTMLWVYGGLIACFFISNFAGHGMEIVGGIRAAKKIFAGALDGALYKPFQWWDSNPTGRVLNRFSADVEVMDKAVTNIFGIIIGAVLFFLGHTLVLTFSSPLSIILLPGIVLLMEYFARYYRNTIREIQRLYLVSQSEVYQEMTDAITGGVTIRAYSAKEQVLMRCLLDLEEFQRASFVKTALGQWIGLRMGLVGFILSTFNQLQPVLQYYGVIATRSAALVGFSINYSNEVSGVVQQFVMNFSDMEMQLVSIERLCEYERAAPHIASTLPSHVASAQGLELRNVCVRYRPHLPPALDNVNLSFSPGETVAIVGRTGAGKSSLILAILQLAPYTGEIEIDETSLHELNEQACGRMVAVVPQQPVLFSGTLRWNLDPSEEFSDQRLWDAIKAVGLLRSCKSALGLNAKVQGSVGGSQPHPGVLALSQGQRQLLCAARALLRQPRVALLDEVTAALPQEAASSTVMELVKKFKEINATTLLVTHQDELTSVCDRTICLSQGRVVTDTASPVVSV